MSVATQRLVGARVLSRQARAASRRQQQQQSGSRRLCQGSHTALPRRGVSLSASSAKRAGGRSKGACFGLCKPHPGRASLASSWCVIPHSDKAARGLRGEDALFACTNAAGVADGVGGWARHGVDAGEFARGLMDGAKKAALSIQEDFGSQPAVLEPLALLARGLRDLTESDTPGSATVGAMTLVPMDTTSQALDSGVAPQVGWLRGAIIGDVAMMVIRAGLVVLRTQPSMHNFFCPRQLGIRSQTNVCDADCFSLDAYAGDIVICATDGLFDNLTDDQIVQVGIVQSFAVA